MYNQNKTQMERGKIMREYKRIERILNKIKILWLKNEDMRLGQLIENFMIQPNRLWYQEDTDTEKLLDYNLKGVTPKK